MRRLVVVAGIVALLCACSDASEAPPTFYDLETTSIVGDGGELREVLVTYEFGQDEQNVVSYLQLPREPFGTDDDLVGAVDWEQVWTLVVGETLADGDTVTIPIHEAYVWLAAAANSAHVTLCMLLF